MIQDTSIEAFEEIQPKIRKMHATIFDWLDKQPNGATDEEMQVALGMNPSTQRPRRGEMVKLGMVAKTPFTRTTKSGKKAIVWKSAVS